MKTQIPAEIIIAIAQVIGSCDFRTTISRYTTSSAPWIITVGESAWRRNLIVTHVDINTEGMNADLGILPCSESSKFGYEIRTDKIELHITLAELVRNKYVGVKKVLFPPA